MVPCCVVCEFCEFVVQVQVKSPYDSATGILDRVKKVEAKTLAKCFPNGKTKTPKGGFDPNADCVVSDAHRKKKAAIKGKQRSVSVSVVMLRQYISTIPKGKARKKLLSEGRIQSIAATRNMTNLQIRNKILRAFEVASFSFLEVDSAGRLVKMKDDSLNGESVVNRRGSLYVYEVEVNVYII